MPERHPLVTNSEAYLRRTATRGVDYDLMRMLTDNWIVYTEDFSLKALDTTNVWTTGGAGTAAAISSSVSGGEAALACNNNASVLFRPNFQWTPDNDCFVTVRLKVSSLATAIKVEVGFSDSENAAALGGTASGVVNSLAATPTLNTGPSDAVCAIFDGGSALTSPNNWRLVSAKAATTSLATPTVTATALAAPTAGTYQKITVACRRIELGATDDTQVVLFVNDVRMASIDSGAITTTAKLDPYVMIKAETAVARTLTVDYFTVGQLRDFSV